MLFQGSVAAFYTGLHHPPLISIADTYVVVVGRGRDKND
jgi:hypothetical protein